MCYPLQTYEKCYSTLLTPYLLLCTYQYHQWTPYPFIGICIHMSWLKTNSFYYWLSSPSRIELIRSPYIKFLLWISHMAITQPDIDINHSVLWSHQWCNNGTRTILHTIWKYCKHANGQFCHISMPFQPLANPPTCIAALYTKSAASIEIKMLSTATQSYSHSSPYTDNPRCMDTHNSYFSPRQTP